MTCSGLCYGQLKAEWSADQQYNVSLSNKVIAKFSLTTFEKQLSFDQIFNTDSKKHMIYK